MLTKNADYLPQYSFVAEYDGEIMGAILYTRSWVEEPNGVMHDMLTFSPLCVLPKYQRQGIGRKLVEYSAEVARINGEKAIIIFGNPSNYVPYGFLSTRDFNISKSDGTYPMAMLTLPLFEGALSGINGVLREAKLFETYDPDPADLYDQKFPPKKKEKTWTQIEFGINSRAILP